MSGEKMDVLLNLLKVEELKGICSCFKVKKTGKKPDLVQALLGMQRTQSTLNGISPLRQRFSCILQNDKTYSSVSSRILSHLIHLFFYF